MGIKLKIYHIETWMGELNNYHLPFLSYNQTKEFNTIGFTGKNTAGKKMSRQKFLNGLNNGKFIVEQIKHSSGTAIEKFKIIRAYLT